MPTTLDRRTGTGFNGAAVLILGVAYKKNVDDIRESPSFSVIELLDERGAKVRYSTIRMFAEIPPTREHPRFAGRRSVPLALALLSRDTTPC